MKFKSEVQLEALNNATVDTDKFLVSDSTTVKYRTGSQLLSDLGVSGLYVPYTGATGNVDLGAHTLSSYNLIVNHTSGSGVAASITKGGSGEALTINKSSGSGNAMSVTGGLTSLVDLTLSSIPNATIDTDRFIVSDSGAIKYRTGAQVLSDIGGQSALTNPITGTGTTNYVSKFTGANSLGNSQIFDNGTNVGINTSSPTEKLSVSGTIRAFGAGNAGRITSVDTQVGGATIAFNPQFSAGVPGIETIGAFPIAFYTNSSEKVRITSGGNVGIATTAPSEKLDVLGVIRNVLTDTLGLGGITAKFLSYLASPYGIIFRGYDTGSHSIQVQREANDAEVFPLLLQPNGSNVKIGGPDAPDLSSILDVQSITKGFLPPRMTTAQRDAIPDPAQGLIIFNTDGETIDVYTTGGWRSTFLI